MGSLLLEYKDLGRGLGGIGMSEKVLHAKELLKKIPNPQNLNTPLIETNTNHYFPKHGPMN